MEGATDPSAPASLRHWVGVSHCTRARKSDDWPAKVRRREEPCDFIAVLIFFRDKKLLFLLVQ